MSQRVWTATRVAALILTVAWVPAAGQAPAPTAAANSASKSAASGKWQLPRTPWGHPDLQGTWNNGTTTSLERPDDLAGRETLTEEEWAARAKEVANRVLCNIDRIESACSSPGPFIYAVRETRIDRLALE